MNELQYEKSPYLLQHKDNPVDWMAWGESAFEKAKREDKPIFLSIGYSTCHWCHVMAHESFENETIAQAMNETFICIKVDREERPDVDGVYMAACVAATGSGGWPLTVLMTPEQKPFWVGTYLKRNELMGLIETAKQLWRDDRKKLLDEGDAFAKHLRASKETAPGTPRRSLAEMGAKSLVRRTDKIWGGTGFSNKFPMPHNLIFLLRWARLTGDEDARRAAELTLEKMSRGGIFDHAGGGFSRYSTDVKWLAPHFEKMLYDNALLLLAYTEAHQEARRAWYASIVRRTADYVLRELRDPMGGFCCGQDADSEGEEGKYYLFTPEELSRLLGMDALPFCRRYGVTKAGNFHGKSILNLIGTEDWETAPAWEAAALEKVREYRLTRTTLHRDDKVLTAWNGLMIGALAKAGLVFGRADWIKAAEQAADFIETNLRGADRRLLARWRDGEAAFDAKLEDCAFCAWGLIALYETTFKTAYLQRAIALGEQLLAEFFDAERGGFYPYSERGEQLLTRTKDLEDGAIPSGNGMAALVLSRLGRLTGEARFIEAEEHQLRYLAGAIERYPASCCVSLLAMLEYLEPTEELVVCARKLPESLTDYLRAEPRQNLTVLLKTPETAEALAQLAPFTADYPVPEGGAMYYRCHNGACERPTREL